MGAATLSLAEARRWRHIGVLAALAMLLGYLESFVPMVIPGAKLGLANIAVLIALAQGDRTGALFVGLVKVVATGLLFGNPVTLAYAATGTLLAFACMAPLSALPTMRLEMVSVVGALAHEAGQLVVAQQLLGTTLVWYGALPLAVAGVITGTLCGVVAHRAVERLAALPAAPGTAAAGNGGAGDGAQGNASATGATTDAPTATVRTTGGTNRRTWPLFASYLVLVVAVMHAQAPTTLAVSLAVALVGCGAARLRPRTLAMALAPSLPLAALTLVAQVASTQQGTPLVWLGPIAITREALTAAGLLLGRLVSVCCASVALVGLVGRDGLARVAQRALTPIRALGIRTAGPELALSTTLELVSRLAEWAPERIEASTVRRRAFWTQALPDLVCDLWQRADEGQDA